MLPPGGGEIRPVGRRRASSAYFMLRTDEHFGEQDSLYSRKKDPKTGRRKNLGTFRSRAAALKRERAVQFFKRRGR